MGGFGREMVFAQKCTIRMLSNSQHPPQVVNKNLYLFYDTVGIFGHVGWTVPYGFMMGTHAQLRPNDTNFRTYFFPSFPPPKNSSMNEALIYVPKLFPCPSSWTVPDGGLQNPWGRA